MNPVAIETARAVLEEVIASAKRRWRPFARPASVELSVGAPLKSLTIHPRSDIASTGAGICRFLAA